MTQPTPPTDRLDQAAADILDQLRAIPDQAERYRAIADVLGANGAFVQALGQLTTETVQEMRAAEMSYGKIAATLGISRSRAQQLATGTR